MCDTCMKRTGGGCEAVCAAGGDRGYATVRSSVVFTGW